jgi:hypothetical protein
MQRRLERRVPKEPAFIVRARGLVQPRDEEWWARARGSVEDKLRQRPELQPLNDRLLGMAGHWCVLPLIEEDLPRLMEHGQPFDPRGTRLMPGAPNRCHMNVARLWDANPDTVQICTGYALSADGLWRQHSWGWFMPKGRVVETTERRILYYGFALNREAAGEFFDENGF